MLISVKVLPFAASLPEFGACIPTKAEPETS